MRLLIIECGDSKLSSAISVVAASLRPKPNMVSTMNLHLNRMNFPEFKHMLYHLALDTIALNPPSDVAECVGWAAVVNEVARHSEVTSGRVLFVSSFEVLGDSYQRMEDAIEMPESDYGMFLINIGDKTRERNSSALYSTLTVYPRERSSSKVGSQSSNGRRERVVQSDHTRRRGEGDHGTCSDWFVW